MAEDLPLLNADIMYFQLLVYRRNNQQTLLRVATFVLYVITVMASLISTTATTLQLQHNHHAICFTPLKSTTPDNFSFLTKRFKSNSTKCNAFFDNIPKDLLNYTFYLDQFPVFRWGLVKFQSVTEDLSDMQKWGFLVFAGLTWIYLTARPGVLLGAIDAYLLAPIQLVLNSLSGRRSQKRTDFLIGDKLGEGSFGVVYSGVLVPKNVGVEERMQKSGRGKVTKLDAKSKDKVILKKLSLRYSNCYPITSLANGIIVGTVDTERMMQISLCFLFLIRYPVKCIQELTDGTCR